MKLAEKKVWVVAVVLALGCSPDEGATSSGDVGVPDTSEMGVDGPKKIDPPSFEDDEKGDNTGGSSEVCQEVNVVAEREVANVLVVLDRSGSMYTSGGFLTPEVDKWTPAVNAVNSAVGARASSVAFGLMKFGTGEGCDPGSVDVMPQLGATELVQQSLRGRPADITGGMTPTAQSLAAAGESLAGVEGDSYILLVTDGAPNCNTKEGLGGECNCPGGVCDYWEQCLDDNRTVSTIESLASNNIKTFVIGYDTGGLTDVLNRMAAAGDTGNSQYIAVNDQASLSSALESLTSQVASCNYALDKAPSDIRYVSVELGGQPVDHESIATTGGWRLDGNNVEILGSDCERLQAQDRMEIDITVKCELVLR